MRRIGSCCSCTCSLAQSRVYAFDDLLIFIAPDFPSFDSCACISRQKVIFPESIRHVRMQVNITGAPNVRVVFSYPLLYA